MTWPTRASSPRRSCASTAGRDRAVTDRLREDLCDLPLLDVAEKIRTRQVSPVEVTERVLARIDALDHTLNAFVTVLSEQALQDARETELEILAGRYRGPLHGVPVSVKDL